MCLDIKLAVAMCVVLLTGLGDKAFGAKLSNGFFSLDISGTGITRMQVDPLGKNPRSMSFAKDLRSEFFRETPATKVTVSGHKATISNLEIAEYRGLATSVGTDNAIKLEQGHTLGQTFRLPAGAQLSFVEVRLPTWNSNTHGCTLSLYRDGKLVASKKLANVPDNSWQQIAPDSPQFEGLYTVEISDPNGDIGWWTSKTGVDSIGEALVDGKPVDGDRALQVHSNQTVGKGSLIYTLDGSSLHMDAEFTPTADMQYKTFPWRWKTTWTKDGYDCTPKSGTVFSRFFTDNLRYLNIQWFKRRDTGAYAFDGCKWIEMDGTKDADLRVEGDRMHLHWELKPDEMHLRLDTPLEHVGDVVKSRLTIVARKRDDTVPPEYPRFTCSDKAVEKDLNTFWWERGFSYPYPPNTSVEWTEWTALTRAWFDDCSRDAQIKMLDDYPMTAEGYVNTYGDIVGWPLVPNRDTRHFDTNARFILAYWRNYLWTGDKQILIRNADRLRKAMNYQLEVLKGKDGLICTPDFKTGRHEDLSDNYWDILPFGHLDAFANAAYYGSLNAMAAVEEVLGKSEIRNPKSEIPDHSSLITHHPPSFYRDLAHKSHKAYDATFWLEDKGRYAGCVDIDGVKHDYGFTFVNLEALFYGLGDAEKARRIYHWMETEPTSSGKADTYTKWIFAPRANTIHNPVWRDGNGPIPVNSEQSTSSTSSGQAVNSDQQSIDPPQPTTYHPTPNTGPVPGPWWTYWWWGTKYGDQCQDGGAILYTSFHDLMDRVKYRGADNAWQRFTEILGRYRMPDRLCGGSPLYRGEIPQQEGAGAVGVDMPFPESGLVPLYYLYGVIGLHASDDGLVVSPALPKSLSYAGVQGVYWHGMRLNIRITRTSVELRGADGAGKRIDRRFPYKPGQSITF